MAAALPSAGTLSRRRPAGLGLAVVVQGECAAVAVVSHRPVPPRGRALGRVVAPVGAKSVGRADPEESKRPLRCRQRGGRGAREPASHLGLERQEKHRKHSTAAAPSSYRGCST